MSAPVTRTREVEVYANRFVTIFDDEVEFGPGKPGRYIRIENSQPGHGVVLLATNGGHIALVHQYRYPVGEWQWGLPRGFAQGEDPLGTAAAELREELGAVAHDAMRVLSTITPDSGLLGSRAAVVHVAVPGQPSEPEDTEEIAAVLWVPLTDLWGWVQAGKLTDGISLAAIAVGHAVGIIPSAVPTSTEAVPTH